jgi:site-specific recombinase XerD
MAGKNTFIKLLASYFEVYLPVVRHASANTIRSYRFSFRLLYTFLSEEKGVRPGDVGFELLNEGTIISWLNWLEDSRGCSVATSNQRLAAMSSFAKYAMNKDFNTSLAFHAAIEGIPKRGPVNVGKAAYLTREEMAIVLRMPNGNGWRGIRDRAILSTLYATGARAQELCDLLITDIRFGNTTTVTLHGKGGRTRTVVIMKQSVSVLKHYIEAGRKSGKMIDGGTHLFSSQTREHMSISCLEVIVKKYISRARGLRPDLFADKYTPHSFRHSIAMHMLESNIPLPVIKAFLGHASIASTLIYASANYEMISRFLRDNDPYASQQDGNDGLPQLLLPSFLA